MKTIVTIIAAALLAAPPATDQRPTSVQITELREKLNDVGFRLEAVEQKYAASQQEQESLKRWLSWSLYDHESATKYFSLAVSDARFQEQIEATKLIADTIQRQHEMDRLAAEQRRQHDEVANDQRVREMINFQANEDFDLRNELMRHRPR